MPEQALVYLSGPISGLTFEGCTDWRDYVSRSFPYHIVGVSPLRAKSYLKDQGVLEGSYVQPMSTARAINARDHFDTTRAKVVLVNLLGCMKPNGRVSIGTVGEMAWAFDRQIPIVCAMEPQDNVHEHPMLSQWIDFRVPTLDEAIEATIAIISPNEASMVSNLEMMRMLREPRPVHSGPWSLNAATKGPDQTSAN